MKLYTIITGLNDKDTKAQEIATSTAQDMVAAIVLRYTDGATLSLCNGIYKHFDGATIYEQSMKIELANVKRIIAEKIAAEIKTALNQETIYFAETKSKINFL